MTNFNGKKVIVTGGCNGIGRCISQGFIKAGASVAVVDIDESAGQDMCNRYGDKLFFMSGDMTRQQTLESFVRQAMRHLDGCDFLINNACVSKKGLLSGCGYEDFNYVLRLGLTAPYYMALLLKEYFRPGAAIVNIASIRAFMSHADSESYAAAKGGIVALTHALSISLAAKVRVNSISPGWIDTSAYQHSSAPLNLSLADQRQQPVGRVGRPEDIANMVMFLCGPQADFITGQDFVIDGGKSKLMIYHGDAGWCYHAEPPAVR